jgi:hypothetical protein
MQPSSAANFGIRLWEQTGKFSTINIHKANHINGCVITEISSAHGYKNSASSNSDEVIHGPELIPQHSKKVKNYTK